MASMMEAAQDAFTFIDRTVNLGSDGGSEPPKLFPKYGHLTSAKLAVPPPQFLEELRMKNPGHVVTQVDPNSLNLLAFAAAGFATATLDTETDSVLRTRAWQQPAWRGATGQLGEYRTFAKYQYQWGKEEFVLYTVIISVWSLQYVLKERGPGEGELSHSTATDTLLAQVGLWSHREIKAIYVYDMGWHLDVALYEQVEKATWDKVILDPGMKKELQSVSGRFFNSKAVYDDLGVPWKRGLIFYGPPGNGKTISIKALMHTLGDRKDSIPTLYVKSAPRTWDIRNVFLLARRMSPCMLVLEDIDTIVTAVTRSFFFNEVDGLENNDGILMVASTNYIDQLDPGLSKRPSRFDRKYLFPLPSKAERVQYVQFWQQKLKAKPEVKFPNALVPPIADITYDFSFAYMQEAFVSSLLDIAHQRNDDDDDDEATDIVVAAQGGGDEDLEKYELWRTIKEQVRILREEMDEKALAGHFNSKAPVVHTGTSTPGNTMGHDKCPAAIPRDANLQYDSHSQRPCCSTVPSIQPTHDILAMETSLARPSRLGLFNLSHQLHGMTFFPDGSGTDE